MSKLYRQHYHEQEWRPAMPQPQAVIRKFSEWMRMHRPDGQGHNVIESYKNSDDMMKAMLGKPSVPDTSEVITFTEVICDLCNAEIRPLVNQEGPSVENVVYDTGSMALCTACGMEWNKETA